MPYVAEEQLAHELLHYFKKRKISPTNAVEGMVLAIVVVVDMIAADRQGADHGVEIIARWLKESMDDFQDKITPKGHA
jgi:hypothetical protein